MKNHVTAFFVITLLLSGCALYSKPKPPTIKTPENFKNTIQATSCAIPDNWWLQFNDNTLNQLENTALKNNYDYQIAIKNIQIAKTYVDENMSALFPMFNLNAAASRNGVSTNSFQSINPNKVYNLVQLYGSASYQVDFWHQVANGVNWAKANLQVARASSNTTRITVVSNIANLYLQLSALKLNLVNLHQQLYITNQIIKLNSDQYKSGLQNIEQLEDAKIQAENIKTTISNTEKQQQITQNTLAYIAGEFPEKFLLVPNSALSIRDINNLIPPNIPAQVIAKRPDIQAAFYQVAAYGYLQKQALANFLPNFSLTANYGFANQSLHNFTSSGSIFWNFAANVIQPMLNFAAINAQYQRAKLQYQTAVLTYQSTVINAFKEVDNSLASYQKDYVALKASYNELQANQIKLKLATAKQSGGIIDHMTYLNYKLAYLQSEYNFINQKLSVYEDIIQVYLALGLG